MINFGKIDSHGGLIVNKHFANKINNITAREEIKLSIPIFYICSNYKLTVIQKIFLKR